ncbi:MAG: DUF2283 domain-containing protein [Thermodesulfobacteriota bacterium]
MADVKVFYDQVGHTLTVWFGDPRDERVCEETGEEVVLMKDKEGRVIGFEKLNYVAEHPVGFQVGFRTASSDVEAPHSHQP